MQEKSVQFFPTIASDMSEKRDEFICLILSGFTTIIVLLIINYLIFLFFKPDTESIIDQAVAMSIYPKDYFLPEPVERTQYILSLLFLPVIGVISYYFINKHVIPFRPSSIKKSIYYFLTGVSSIGGLIFTFFVFSTNRFLYFKGTILQEQYYLTLFCFFSLILIYFLSFFLKNKLDMIISASVKVFSFALIGMIGFMRIFNKNEYFGWMPHLNAVFYSISQVYKGKTLLVNFNNQYGLYPHFLDPFFQLVSLSILKYSIVMSILTIISLLFIFLFLDKTVSNKIILFLGFTTTLYCSILWLHLLVFDVYFQYWPIRTLFPAVIIFLTTLYFQRENRYIYYCIFILSSIAIYWNLDSGVVVFLSWLAVLLFSELDQDRKKIIKNCSKHIIVGFGSFFVVSFIVILIIYFRSGNLPDLFQFFQYQHLFYIAGLTMLPLELFHPWNIIILVYLFSFIYSIQAVVKKNITNISKTIFLLTILGLGLFSYYQGRSHDYVLVYVIYPAILLLTIFTDISLSNIKRYGYHLYHNLLFVVCILFILSVPICSIGFHFTQYYQYSERGFFALNDTNQSSVSDNINFIREHTIPGEKTLILSDNYDGIYYGESNTESILNIPGSTEIIYKKDLDKISDYLNNCVGDKIFIDRSNHNCIFNDILNFNYDVISESITHQIVLLKRNDSKKVSSHNLIIEPDTIYHSNSEMFFNQPIIDIDKNFTLQALIKPGSNQFPYAVIIGNHPGFNGNEGFVIQQDDKKMNNYSFVYGDGSSWTTQNIFHLNEDRWNYLVIIVKEGTIQIYNNGILIEESEKNKEIKNSKIPLIIGNWDKNDRPFNGSVQELMISNSSISLDTIKKNCETIHNNGFAL